MATRTETDRLEQVLLGQQKIVEEVGRWLQQEDEHDAVLRALVLSSKGERNAVVRNMEADRIFHIDAIKALCIRYRLRFLDAGLFKGTIPPQAVHAVRDLERRTEGALPSFKIMAPAERFRLCDSEADPLLFVPVGDDRYYLVHKWGNDLVRWRSLAGWPFRSPVQLGITVLLLAVLLTALLPTSLITTDPEAGAWGAHRVLFFFWSSMVLASFTVFGWFAFFGQFSAEAWNSRYFN